MKRKLKKTLALVLMLCMLLPQTAMAATGYYLDVSIEGPDANGVTQMVSARSNSDYATMAEPLAANVVQIVDSMYDELERVYKNTGLRSIVDDGLNAFKYNSWTSYVNQYFNDVTNMAGVANFKTVLSNTASTFADLQVNTENKISYEDYMGRTYVVTITLKDVFIGGGSQKPEEEHPIEIVDTDPNGSISVSEDESPAGKRVTVTLDPNDGYRTNQVKVIDQNGNPVTVVAVDNNTYTFTMPDGSVTVTATFILDTASTESTGIDGKLNTDPDFAYMQGKTDGLFHPGDNITRGQVATIFYRLLKDEQVKGVVYTKSFKDVPATFWCYDAISTLAALGIVNGMTADTFAPNQPITRAQFVAICARFAEITAEGEEFTDVPESYWAHDYIGTASGFGWVNGVGGGLFSPNAKITRAQAATIVNRMLCRVPDRALIDSNGVTRYPDVPATYWAYYDIWEASAGAITRPDSN